MTTTTPSTTGGGTKHQSLRRRFTVAGILLGLGLGGFFDGIVLHQILQWHHMLTDHGTHASYPATSVGSLEDNTLWDGLFHLSTWVFVGVGVFVLWRTLSAGYRATWRSMIGLLLAGWGSSTWSKASSITTSSPSTTSATTSPTRCGGTSASSPSAPRSSSSGWRYGGVTATTPIVTRPRTRPALG